MHYLSPFLFLLMVPGLSLGQNDRSADLQINGRWEPTGSDGLGDFQEGVKLLFNDIRVNEESGTFTGTSEQAEVSFAILHCLEINESTFTFRVEYEIFKPLRDRDYHPGRKNKYLIVKTETNRKGKLKVEASFVGTANDPDPDFSRLRRMKE
jgi:hypothetical protein